MRPTRCTSLGCFRMSPSSSRQAKHACRSVFLLSILMTHCTNSAVLGLLIWPEKEPARRQGLSHNVPLHAVSSKAHGVSITQQTSMLLAAPELAVIAGDGLVRAAICGAAAAVLRGRGGGVHLQPEPMPDVGSARRKDALLLREDCGRAVHREAAPSAGEEVVPGDRARLLPLSGELHAARRIHVPGEDHGRVHGN